MPSHAMTLPELNRRLLEERGAFVDTAEALRSRMRQKARNLLPQRQLQRHPEAGLVLALGAGLLAGRIAGGILGSLLR